MDRHEIAEHIFGMFMNGQLRLAVITVGGVYESLTGESSWLATGTSLADITVVLDDMSQDGPVKRIDAGDGAVRYEYKRPA